jgi:hypothetical protein
MWRVVVVLTAELKFLLFMAGECSFSSCSTVEKIHVHTASIDTQPIFTQYSNNICTIFTQFSHRKISTQPIFTQYSNNICTIFTHFSHRKIDTQPISTHLAVEGGQLQAHTGTPQH